MARVLLTRTAVQGAPFERALNDLAAERGIPKIQVDFAPMQLPRTVAPEYSLFSLVSLAAEGAFLWATFTSANAVRSCAELFGTSFAWALRDGGTRIACVGSATARALREIGLEPHFMPEKQDALGMLAEFPTEGANPELGIPESLRKPQNTPESVALGWDDMLSAQASVLVFEGANARSTLREGLVGLGFRAVRAVVYEMVPATASVLEAGEISCVNARELIAGGIGSNSAAVDVIIATAPSRLKELVGENPNPERTPPVAAIGRTTARTCEELGLRHRTAASPTPEALALAAIELLRSA
ncbi:uroporphyrinogen-III synthase [Rothia dentocariosa]|uniref:uroporphyrinogen-III synthase n=1 Tax=Rothia dentocariosa TaxID=2047 RepID=UPI0010728F2C|nr:uroporphyrinogen-III synthase [Rothia dentocariosa]TFI36378.1 uroporphyrinogen-III synthase [Rothia dentocariosa]